MAAEERHTETENRIRAAMAQLLGGDIPEGLRCDVKSLCTLSGVPRATLYRSYPHIKADFERERSDAPTAGQHPDPRLAQIERLKTEIIDLHKRLNRETPNSLNSGHFEPQRYPASQPNTTRSPASGENSRQPSPQRSADSPADRNAETRNSLSTNGLRK